MLDEKYRPRSTKEMLGNRLAAMQLAGFLQNWKPGQAVLITGPPGCGKSLLVALVCQELRYDIVLTGADEERASADMGALTRAAQQGSLVQTRKVFVVEDADRLITAKALSGLIAGSRHPVVLIAEDAYDRKLQTIRRNCLVIKLARVRQDSIAKLLAMVSAAEGWQFDEGVLAHLAATSDGDVRAALLDLLLLQAGRPDVRALGYREQTAAVFDTLKIIFKTTSLENALIALWQADDPEMVIRWIGENLAAAYDDIVDIAAAYERISRADIFATRILRRQAWPLQKYAFELGTAGVALAKQSPPASGFFRYMPPRYLPRERLLVYQKIAPHVHVSTRKAMAYRPLLISLKKNQRLWDALGLEKEEVAALTRKL